MNPSRDPKEDLRSPNERVRLKAARKLALEPNRKELDELRRAIAREDVRWVKSALERAVRRCEAADSEENPELDAEEDLRQTYIDGRRDGLRQALHELTPLLGLARAAALEDPPNANEVRKQLERMHGVTAALRGLVTAAAAPTLRDFDLAELLSEIASSPPLPCPEGLVGSSGTTPYIVHGDENLIALAVQPLVINAIEAVIQADIEPTRRSVMICWGAESSQHWIAVLDEGGGPSTSDSELFAVGVSGKAGHLGLGLETAMTAIHSLGGEIDLRRNRRHGATAVLRWPRT